MSIGWPQCSQVSRGSAISPQVLWRSTIGGPSGPARCVVPPAHQRDDGGEQVASGVGQPVLVAVGVAGVLDALEQAGIDQCPQTSGEGGPWNVEVAGELSVASYAEERLAHDQHRPALAEESERASDRLAVESVR